MLRAIASWVFVALATVAPAHAWKHGSVIVSGEIKRTVLNINNLGIGVQQYIFIDHFKEGVGLGPFDSSWNMGGTPWSSGILDANGWPNHSANGRGFGGSIFLPASSNFAGPYCFDSSNTVTAQSGTIFLLDGTWTQAANTTCANGSCTGSGATLGGAGPYTVTVSGTNWCIPLTYSGTGGTVHYDITNTDPSSTGAYLRDLHWYRQSDASDFKTSGRCSPKACVYRNAYLQMLIALNPGAIRFDQWDASYNGPSMRFENRMPPNMAGVSGSDYVCGSPPYGDTAGTNQYSLSSVVASGCGPASPVGTYKHGETVYARVTNAATTNCGSGLCPVVTAITNAAAAAITTGTAHGFSMGDKVILYIDNGNMPKLTRFPVTVASVVDATHFTISFNSTSAGTFNAGTCGATGNTCFVTTYVSLNIASRGEVPVTVATDGFSSINMFNSTQFVAGNYYTLLYDKNSSAITDGAGNKVFGVWLKNIGNYSVPTELEVAMINELNALKAGGVAKTHMYYNVPYLAMTPNDPDYTTGSDYPANIYNVIMNGANGFAGLCAGCRLYIENANENWNSFSSAFVSAQYYIRQSCLRWNSCSGDTSSFSTLKGMWTMQDIKTATSYAANASRTRTIIGLWGGVGISNSNITSIYGNNFLNADTTSPVYTGTLFTGTISGSTLTVSGLSGPLGVNYSVTGGAITGGCIVTAGSGPTYTVANAPPSGGNCSAVGPVSMTAALAPMTYFDHGASAPYQTLSNPTMTTDVTAGAAAYMGSCSSVTTQVQTFVNDLVADTTPGSGMAGWVTTMNAFGAALQQFGKTAINYEGGPDLNNPSNPFYTGVIPNGNAFVDCVSQSSALGTAQANFFTNTWLSNANLELPALYVAIGNHVTSGPPDWEFTSCSAPDSYFLTPGTEGVCIPLWTSVGTYNQRTP
jgi:hypothetical protein